MRVDTDSFACNELPVFMDRTEVLMKWIQSLSYEEQKKLWVCNDKIARQNAERFAHMDLRKNLTPALLAYDGIQYTYMAPAVFEDGQYDYVQEHLRILSGFYGVVKAMDGVVPYRLEMQAKAAIGGYKNLYDFWGDSLYHEVIGDSRTIINLASKEYSKCIEKYLQPEDRYITCVFGELEGDKVVQKGVYAKMARGEMVRFMAGQEAEMLVIASPIYYQGLSGQLKCTIDRFYAAAYPQKPAKLKKWTTESVDIPLMHEKRTGHVNLMTKNNWLWRKLYEAARSVQNGRKISDYVEAGGVAAAILSSSGRI